MIFISYNLCGKLHQVIILQLLFAKLYLVRVVVFNATFNNMSVIL